jgi:hypothetical protein
MGSALLLLITAAVEGVASANLTMGPVDAEIQHLLPHFQECYMAALKRDAKIGEVDLTFDFTLQPTGQFTDAVVDTDRGGDGAFEACVLAVVDTGKVASGPEDPADISYPMVFTH